MLKAVSAFGNSWKLLDGVEEFGVRFEFVQRLEEPFHRFHWLQREERAAELLDLLVLVLAEQLLFLALPRGLDVDGWEDALFRDLAIRVVRRFSGPLELLKIPLF